jgi:hypothetical protein
MWDMAADWDQTEVDATNIVQVTDDTSSNIWSVIDDVDMSITHPEFTTMNAVLARRNTIRMKNDKNDIIDDIF